jgi:hypothetical protein
MILILLSFLSLSSAEARSVRTAYDRIEEGCGARLKEEQITLRKLTATCKCLVSNVRSLNLGDEALNLLASSYENDPKAEEALNQEKWAELVEKDFVISEGCLEDPTYQFKQ